MYLWYKSKLILHVMRILISANFTHFGRQISTRTSCWQAQIHIVEACHPPPLSKGCPLCPPPLETCAPHPQNIETSPMVVFVSPPPYFFHNTNLRAKYTSYSTFWRLMCNFLHLLRITPQSPPPLLSAPQCILAPSGGSKECGQKFKSVPNSPKWQKICIKIAS